MISYKKILSLSCCVFLLHGCATAYKPSASVLDMSSSMSKAEAANMVNGSLVKPDPKQGICRANGIPGAGFLDNGWDVNEKNPELMASADGVSFNALRRVLSHSTSGNIATQGAAGLATSTTTTLTPFRRSINYADLDTATIFYKESALNRLCFFDEGYAEVRVSLATGTGHWISLLIKNENLEKFIAAAMIVAPKIKFQTK